MNDGFANVVSAVQIGNGELLLTDRRWRRRRGESFSYGIYRTTRALRKFVDLQRDINGDKRRKLYGPKISVRKLSIFVVLFK